jgi:gliding motility-associated lipoprotein GldH
MVTKPNHKLCLILCLAVLSLVSCTDRSAVWQQNIAVKDGIWNKDSVLIFDIPAEDTVRLYSMSIHVRNRTDYSFQNLYLFLTVEAPNKQTISDTLNFNLAYDDGQWTGSGGVFSKYRENIFLYRKYIRFPEQGIYRVTVRHGMRKDNLEGVSSIGMALNYLEN